MVQRAMCILSIHKMMMAKSWCIVMKIPVGVSRFYFKFGSANLQAQVQAFGNENKLANQVLRLADDDVR